MMVVGGSVLDPVRRLRTVLVWRAVCVKSTVCARVGEQCVEEQCVGEQCVSR